MQKNIAPLLWPTLFWILGIIVAKYLQPQPLIIIFATFLSLVAALLLAAYRPALILLLFFLCSMLNYHLKTALPSNHLYFILENQAQITQPLTGKIVSEVKQKDDKYFADIALLSIARQAVSGKFRLYTKQDSLRYGDTISLVVNLTEISEVSNPGGFDLQEYFQTKEIYAFGFAKTAADILSHKPAFITNQVIKARQFIRQRIEERFAKYGGFIKAIVIADRSDLDAERSLLSNAGLSHLLAVSGLHVAIIALILYSLLNTLLPNRLLSRLVTIGILLFYAAICDFSPSVSRAVIMISIFLTAKILCRKTDIINTLALSLLLITALKPAQLFSIGLQMSFVAVATLVLFIPKLKLIPYRPKLPLINKLIALSNGIILIMISSFVLSLFLAPLTIFNFYQFNLNGIIANIVGIPIISVILSLSLIVIFLPELGGILQLYQLSLDFVLKIFYGWSEFAAQLPLNWRFVSINLLQCILLYLVLVMIFHPKNKLWLRACSLLFLVIIFSCNLGEEALEITFFDCGLGDLFLIKSPAGVNIMIDTGPSESSGAHFKNSVLPYLRQQGIASLDYLIVTHAHNDHYGGLKSVLEELQVQRLLVTDEFMARNIWRFFEPTIAQRAVEVVAITDTISFHFADFSLQILHPDKDFSDPNKNNLSIVARAVIDSLTVLFPGDLEAEGEHYLLEKYPQFLSADILKIGHHGSKTASSSEMLKIVKPQFGIIPTAVQNRFDFPHEVTLERLAFLEDKLFITGKDGAITLQYRDQKAYISTYKTQKEFILQK
ncbi:MAG: DNA internalization-related competence protein ComEC/Rec2 [Candidatus Cloacimonadales bacterium]